MKLRILLAAALGAGFLLSPTVAAAKGPVAVAIDGPGLDAPIELDRAGNTQSSAGRLVEAAGFWEVFAPYASGTIGAAVPPPPPERDRGPRYRVTYFLGSDRVEQVRQNLYPFAEGGPLAYTPANQRVFGEESPYGGWRRLDAGVADLLVSLGVPSPAERKGWSTARDGELGLAISHPRAWQAAKSRVAEDLLDPVIPLALGTYDFPTGGCGMGPGPALEAMGPTDAFVAVYVGYGSFARTSREQPAAFSPDLPWSEGPFKCTEKVRGTVRMLHFQVGERRLAVLIAFGPEASERRQQRVYRILDTLVVAPQP